MSTPPMGGASITARTRTPSINLFHLAEILAKALAPSELSGESLFSATEGRLNVNLGSALRYLFKAPAFKEDFAAGTDTGFFRDLELPPKGTTAKVGGRLLPGSEGKTTFSIEKLQTVIAEHLDNALSSTSLQALAVLKTRQALDTLAKNLQVRLPEAPSTASLVPVGFASAERKVGEREKDVARVLSAIELVDGRDFLSLPGEWRQP